VALLYGILRRLSIDVHGAAPRWASAVRGDSSDCRAHRRRMDFQGKVAQSARICRHVHTIMMRQTVATPKPVSS
jgi:hypothetical protein